MTGGGAAGLAAIGLYGLVLAVAGVVVTANGAATAAARAGRDSVTGRRVGAAPVVAPGPGARTPHTTTSGGSPVPAGVPSAAVGAEIAARPVVFAPARLVLP